MQGVDRYVEQLKSIGQVDDQTAVVVALDQGCRQRPVVIAGNDVAHGQISTLASIQPLVVLN